MSGYDSGESFRICANRATSRPCLSSCSIGVFNVIYNIAIRSPLPWTSRSITAMAIALSSTTIYAIIAIMIYHQISIVRKRDALHRRPSSWQEDSSSLLTEDDAQRQQLLRLLRKSNTDRAPSPALSQSTYRIDLPETVNFARQSNVYNQYPIQSHLAPVGTTFEGRSISQPPPIAEQTVWGSQVSGGQMSKGSVSTLSRDLSSSSREQRRQEIEMNLGMHHRYEIAGEDIARSTIPRITRVQTDGLGLRV